MAQLTMKLSAAHLERISRRQKTEIALGTNQGADLSQWCGPVFNQYQEGSCTACTTRDYLLWLENKYGYNPKVDPDVQALYYFARVVYGDVGQDGGSTVHDAFQGAITYGVIPSADEAYTEQTLFTEPPMQDIVFQASSVKDLPTTTAALRASLDAGIPPAIGVNVTDTLMTPSVYNGSHIVDKGTLIPNEGHAIPVFAYKPDPVHQYLYKVQNSWGTSYGDQGFVWFTEAFMQQCLTEVCTLDIPKTFTKPTNIPPLPSPNNHFSLTVTSDKSTCVIGDTAEITVTLTNNGQPLAGQYVQVSINGGGSGPLPITSDGTGSIPWAPSNAGTYTFTAKWDSLTASCAVTFTQPAPKPQPTPQPKPAYLSGGDVSKFQGNISWPQVEKSWAFDQVKAIDGRGPVDPNFLINYANSIKAGVVTGAYQVAYPALGDTPQASYDAYKELIEAHGGFILPPTLDLEETGYGSLSAAQVTQWAHDWLTLAIADFGQAIIYSDEASFQSHIDVTKLPKGTLLWVANYAKEPSMHWDFWQHTDAAAVQGIAGKVDTDYFRGTADELKALCVGGEHVQTTKVNVNGHDFAAVVVGADTYILWTELETFPGFTKKFVNGEWHFTVPAQQEKPVSVTLTYGDGTTQTTKL